MAQLLNLRIGLSPLGFCHLMLCGRRPCTSTSMLCLSCHGSRGPNQHVGIPEDWPSASSSAVRPSQPAKPCGSPCIWCVASHWNLGSSSLHGRKFPAMVSMMPGSASCQACPQVQCHIWLEDAASCRSRPRRGPCPSRPLESHALIAPAGEEVLVVPSHPIGPGSCGPPHWKEGVQELAHSNVPGKRPAIPGWCGRSQPPGNTRGRPSSLASNPRQRSTVSLPDWWSMHDHPTGVASSGAPAGCSQVSSS